MLRVVESKRRMREIQKAFPEVAAHRGFGVLGVYNLKQRLIEKGEYLEKDCLIFEVCNARQAAKVLKHHPDVATALPCRVCVYEEDGISRIAVLRPTAVLDLFVHPDLKAVAEEVERELFAIMEDLALEKSPAAAPRVTLAA